MGSGKVWRRASWWNGCSRTASVCGWGCNCTRSCGARRLARPYFEGRASGQLMTHSRKAVVLLSGGMDSCVCAAIARERHGAANLVLLHAMYGQRTDKRERQEL